MIPDPLARHAAVAIVSLLTGVISWWSGRSLLAVLDDPVLPERLLAHRKRNRIVFVVALAFAAVMGDRLDLLLAAPVIVAARLAAGYSLRRRLYDEQWSLWAYASCMIRLLVAVAAFRVLLVGAPLIASAAGSLDWLAALALGALLFAWNSRSAEIFRWLVGSKPLDDGALVLSERQRVEGLLARFRAIAAASGAPEARFELVDLRGGAIANALALPSLRGSSVLYTDTLLRLLDAEEAAAITAHEIAHLEHFDRARLRRLNWIMRGLIFGATACAMPVQNENTTSGRFASTSRTIAGCKSGPLSIVCERGRGPGRASALDASARQRETRTPVTDVARSRASVRCAASSLS